MSTDEIVITGEVSTEEFAQRLSNIGNTPMEHVKSEVVKRRERVKRDILRDALSDNRRLIVVTGMSGSGKSTLAMEISKYMGAQVLSLDNFKIEVYERFGFLNKAERLCARDAAIALFKMALQEIMRTRQSVIIEYPFKKEEWQSFIEDVCSRYEYSSVIVNCNSVDFCDLWERRNLRDSNKEVRHRSLTAQAYVKGEVYELDTEKYSLEEKGRHRKLYEEGVYTSLSGGYNFTDGDVYEYLCKGEGCQNNVTITYTVPRDGEEFKRFKV